MNKQNLDELASLAEKRAARRDERKRKRMKVSGAGLKELQRIIIAKK